MTDVSGPRDLAPTQHAVSENSVQVPQLNGVVYASETLPEPKGDARVAPEDKIRRTIAIALIVLLAVIVGAGFTLMAVARTIGLVPDDLKSLVQLFFTSILTLVSTVLGFYFGAEKRPKEG